MKNFSVALAALVLTLVASSANAAPKQPIAPAFDSARIDAQKTCHHLRWSSQRRCTSTRLLRQYYARRPNYYRGETGVVHYGPPFAYYGYIPYRGYYGHYRPYGFYRSYGY